MEVCVKGRAVKLCRNVMGAVWREVLFPHAFSREAVWASARPLQAPYYRAICADLHDRVLLLFLLRFTCQQAPPTIVLWWELNSAVCSGWGLERAAAADHPVFTSNLTPPHPHTPTPASFSLPHLSLLQREEIQTSCRWGSIACKH